MNTKRRKLYEMAGVALPVVRKTLRVESASLKFSDLKPGMVLELPNKRGKKYVIVEVATFGKYIHFVEFKGNLEMARESDLSGAKAGGMGEAAKPIDV